MFCLSSGSIYLALDISWSCSFITVSELFSCEFLMAFMILLALLLPIESQVGSAVFWVVIFEAGLNEFVADILAWSRSS